MTTYNQTAKSSCMARPDGRPKSPKHPEPKKLPRLGFHAGTGQYAIYVNCRRIARTPAVPAGVRGTPSPRPAPRGLSRAAAFVGRAGQPSGGSGPA